MKVVKADKKGRINLGTEQADSIFIVHPRGEGFVLERVIPKETVVERARLAE